MTMLVHLLSGVVTYPEHLLPYPLPHPRSGLKKEQKEEMECAERVHAMLQVGPPRVCSFAGVCPHACWWTEPWK